MTTSTFNQIETELTNLQNQFDAIQKEDWANNFQELSKREDLISEAISAICRIKETMTEETYCEDAIIRANY